MSLFRSKLVIEILFNAALPWMVYGWLQPGMGRVHALMLSAVPPILWSAIQLVRKRRIDAFSILVIAGIGLSLLAFLGGGSFRMLELREHLITGVLGLVFVGSVAIKRPMLAVLLGFLKESVTEAESRKIQRLLDDRRRLARMTLVLGILSLAQTTVAAGLVFTLPVREFLVVGPILNYALVGLLAAGLFYTSYRSRAASAQAAHEQRETGNRD